MPQLKSFEVFSQNRPLGELKDHEWNGRTVLCAQCHTGSVPYGLIIGFRVEEKNPDEKPGDVIKILALDEKRGDSEEQALIGELTRFFSRILDGRIIFYW
ncbi:MAG: hypothetical protein JWN89_79 [Parcubacteria group bacterium]|nr:hypothetical protein [Parcubacteria group bacterium]